MISRLSLLAFTFISFGISVLHQQIQTKRGHIIHIAFVFLGLLTCASYILQIFVAYKISQMVKSA